MPPERDVLRPLIPQYPSPVPLGTAPSTTLATTSSAASSFTFLRYRSLFRFSLFGLWRRLTLIVFLSFLACTSSPTADSPSPNLSILYPTSPK